MEHEVLSVCTQVLIMENTFFQNIEKKKPKWLTLFRMVVSENLFILRAYETIAPSTQTGGSVVQLFHLTVLYNTYECGMVALSCGGSN